jgi:acyl-CoA thioesterase
VDHVQDDHDFLGDQQIDDRTWRTAITPELCSPAGGLYGGAGLAMAAAALESVTSRPLRWITCQFVASGTPGETLTTRVEIDAEGHRITQASVWCGVGERTVLRVVAALGDQRPDSPSGTWLEPPLVPGPEECTPLVIPFPTDGTCFDLTERRIAVGPGIERFARGEPSGPGLQFALWSRIVGHLSTTPAMLAWLADIVPMGVSAGLAVPLGAMSLDNTLRVVGASNEHSDDWVLVDIRPGAAAEGYAHGDVHLWSRDGTLLATGSQTAVLRRPRLPS